MQIFALVNVLLSKHLCRAGMSKDFIVGFESGIFVRDDDNAFDDYSCEPPKLDKPFIQQVNGYVTPIKMMAGLSQNAMVEGVVDSIEIFVRGIASIINVFSGEYDGGDFCTGLIFGKYGAKMLT